MNVAVEKYRLFLEKHQDLFWHFDSKKLDALSHDIVVEYILNYGDEEAVKELISLLGINQVAKLFFSHTKKDKRTNYIPEVKNFFTLYFNRNASGNIK